MKNEVCTLCGRKATKAEIAVAVMARVIGCDVFGGPVCLDGRREKCTELALRAAS